MGAEGGGAEVVGSEGGSLEERNGREVCRHTAVMESIIIYTP